ncbi:hypothetical protein AcV7_010368 [Taiwanofungus camphoratus]|nr:hypothetical protein AcV7_010368 [Antrodia cinnamomea]
MSEGHRQIKSTAMLENLIFPPQSIPMMPFFVNQSPPLHMLRTHKVILPWYPFRNLTEMDIENDRHPAMDVLLQILRDCSSPIVLKLDIQRAILRTSYPQDPRSLSLLIRKT